MKTELHLPCTERFVLPGAQNKTEMISTMPCCAGLFVCLFSLWDAVVQKGHH